jgi:uncharacterized membrane protein
MSAALRDIAPARIAGMIAVIGTLAASALHVVFGMQAGALWRDEVNSLELATVGTLSEMWMNLDYDSFPALFFLVLRSFAGVPASASDVELRAFGVTIGLLILGALWLNARVFRFGVPLVSLALIGFNPMVIRYGDSIRAYGLGTLLILLVLPALWKVVEAPTPRRIIVAGLAALLSVQCLYYNAILLFAICLGAVAVAIRHRLWKRGLIVLTIGAICAVSLLPYLPIFRRVGSWNYQFKAQIDFAFLWGKLSETIATPVSMARWVWVVLLFAAIFAGAWVLLRKSEESELAPAKDRALFALVTLVVAIVGYAGFLRILSYVTQPWYYVVLLVFAAVCIETLLGSLPVKKWLQLARCGFALAFIGAATFPTWQALQVRQTNIDLIARKLEALAKDGDLILLSPWNYGITFRRYYHHETLCATLPPVEDLRFHRCDIVKRQMMSNAPMAPVLQKMDETLRAGKTIWLVGQLIPVAPGQRPLEVPPGYDGPDGFVSGPLYRAWMEQAGFFVQTHATDIERIPLPSPQPIMHFEAPALSSFRGWRSDSGTVAP